MENDWTVAPLDDVVDDILDRRGVTPFKLGSTFTEQGHRVISAKVIKDGRVDLSADEPRHVDDATYAKWMRRPLRADDVLLTSEAPLGEAAYIATDTDWVLGQRLFAIRTEKRRLHGRFLYYALKGGPVARDLHARATGTTAQGIRQSELRRVAVPLPPLNEQRAIAAILGAFDDKIDVNRRMSETLEAMARALFKSWFVDFDPVQAKMEGRPVYRAASLFPDAFADSELGSVPAGWTAAPLGSHFKAVKGVSYKGSGLAIDGVPMHNLNSIHEGGGYKYEGLKFYSGEFADRHVVRPGDLIVANTEQGHDRLLIGYAAIVPRLAGDTGIASHHIYRLDPVDGTPLTSTYVAHLLNSQRMHETVSGYANGTTVNMLPTSGVEKPVVVVPPAAIVREFDDFAAAAASRVEVCVRESRTLAATRDALLPRLISGEVRVPDAEHVAAESGV